MVSMSAPLALDSAAFGEAVGLRRGEGIVDSLAYIDTITTDEQRHAESLIKEEVAPWPTLQSLAAELVQLVELLSTFTCRSRRWESGQQST